MKSSSSRNLVRCIDTRRIALDPGNRCVTVMQGAGEDNGGSIETQKEQEPLTRLAQAFQTKEQR